MNMTGFVDINALYDLTGKVALITGAPTDTRNSIT
jgi:hypothetical protein